MSRVLVVGEACIDNFIYCDATRLDPATPVPILNIKFSRSNDGMAKNVVNSLNSMGLECDYIFNKNWEQSSKTRYVDDKSNHMFIRVDNDIHMEKINLSKISYDYEVIVISDYNKGFIDESQILEICNNHPRVFIDTKKPLGKWAEKAFIIKINDYEYKNSINAINDKLKNKIIHTDGANGCEYQGNIYSVDKVEVKDSSGAGDTFMAALVFKYMENNDIIDAIKFANKCASEVVKHRGVTVI